MILGIAMAESTGIYALVIALILLFANPFVSQFWIGADRTGTVHRCALKRKRRILPFGKEVNLCNRQFMRLLSASAGGRFS